ncbi:(2Fe-2S)-binding protein [Archangium minus]|uniref:Bacterioferritin-associated ferredoxin n=1 Tax=Archangium minus TaxID=83450 RepID=A0ABY9WNQ3_9BACT|nr:(2Fe-2S)-binding protein [Archangium violaceum]WNG45353.1 (2Fe-2S)-binding protein [Archangium minus]
MIVCLCYVVSDRTIRARISEGVETVDDLGRACGAGTGCGGCKSQLAQLLMEARQGTCGRSTSREGCTGIPLPLVSAAL